MKCIGYNTNSTDAISKSNQMGTNTVHILTNIFRKVAMTKS